MRTVAVAIAAVLSAVYAAGGPQAFAGGPQSPPTITDTSGGPTVATVVSYSDTSSVAPLYPTSAPAGLSSTASVPTYPGSPMTPIPVNGSSSVYPISSVNPGGPVIATSMPGNLSTTAKHPSTSVVVATVTGSGGGQSTETSVMLVTPSASASPSSSSSPHTGDAGKLQGAAAVGLAFVGGLMVFLL